MTLTNTVSIRMPIPQSDDERIRKAQEKAWDEGAIHAFSRTGEGWNAEYPFDFGKLRSFVSEAIKDNPYRR